MEPPWLTTKAIDNLNVGSYNTTGKRPLKSEHIVYWIRCCPFYSQLHSQGHIILASFVGIHKTLLVIDTDPLVRHFNCHSSMTVVASEIPTVTCVLPNADGHRCRQSIGYAFDTACHFWFRRRDIWQLQWHCFHIWFDLLHSMYRISDLFWQNVTLDR